jgi:tetratricopeptide (TPR) repeat protein
MSGFSRLFRGKARDEGTKTEVGKTDEKTASRTPESRIQKRPAPGGTAKTLLLEALVFIQPNGQEMYEKDKEQALRWFASKGFPNPGVKEEATVRWFLEMSVRADDSSLWDEAWGGYHHALAGAAALNITEQVPDICWHLGRAQTGRAQYELANLYLEAAASLAETSKNKDLTCRALIEVAVVGKLSEKPERVQQAYQKVEGLLFPSGGDTSFAAKVAMTLFQEGKRNQEWRRDGKPVRYCLVHASGFYQVSLDINRRLNEKRGISIILINLGDVWRKLGQRDRALAYWKESIPILKELQDQQNIDLVNRWMNET